MRIGNDIVDLKVAKIQSNWKRTGYLNKIFTQKEQKFISESENQNETVWHLWSRKEAVYKIIIQKGGIRGYYPIKIECLNLDLNNGVVCFKNQYFYTKTTVLNDAIYSIAVENKNHFNRLYEIKEANCIEKINGLPYVKIGQKYQLASKTHHGRFEKIISLQI